MRHGGVPSRPRRQRRPPRPAVPACLRPAGLWVLRRRHADVPAFLDAAAPALLVAQSIGRVGNYFNQELFGGPTSLPWGLEIDAAHRPAGYAAYATFHPTFLYEIVWNLGLAGFLVVLARRRRIRPPGLFALYVAGYSAFRIFEESLRIDPAHHIFGLRLNFYVASALCIAGLTWFLRTQRPPKRAIRRGATLLAAGWLLCAAAGCGHAGAGADRPAAAPQSSRVGRALTGAVTRLRAEPPAYVGSAAGRSRSTRFNSTALVATMIELADIRSADHSGRSSIPADG